jgi:glycosyltransferase involved in cell wall biosynthesis
VSVDAKLMDAKVLEPKTNRIYPRDFSLSSIKQVAVIGNYVPRQCGIATFTTDLCEALGNKYPDKSFFALPIIDDLAAYQTAADFLNTNNIDLVCLQHEYGIFGGTAGSHILALLSKLRMPVVTTLHTVLKKPEEKQRRVLEEIARLSDRLVAISQRAAQFLRDIYGVPEEQIDRIPHGIHDMPFLDPNFSKDRFGFAGKIVVLTFGFLSPNKGIEYVIKALPLVLKRFPNVVYAIAGVTHPHEKIRQGESYRLSLQRLARAMGVDRNVVFYNRFLSLEELTELIGAADIYITPYLNPAQIVSGTLSYALGAGKAVISTPYWHAEELLSGGCGILVPFADADAIAAQIIALLHNEAERHAMRKRAYQAGRQMVWPTVATLYMRSFENSREERKRHPRPLFIATTLKERTDELPVLRLDQAPRKTMLPPREVPRIGGTQSRELSKACLNRWYDSR